MRYYATEVMQVSPECSPYVTAVQVDQYSADFSSPVVHVGIVNLAVTVVGAAQFAPPFLDPPIGAGSPPERAFP